ncbi:MAG: hypothetical protein ABFC88_12775 [Thermoguttaceae bacterium]
MTVEVYRTTGFFTRSVLTAEHVATTNPAEYPEDPQAFADGYDGDILETSPLNNEDEQHGEVRHG